MNEIRKHWNKMLINNLINQIVKSKNFVKVLFTFHKIFGFDNPIY